MSKIKMDQSIKALFSLYRYSLKSYLSADLLRVLSSVIGAFLPWYLAKIATSTNDIDYLFFIVSALFINQLIHGLLWTAGDYVYAYGVKRSLYKYREIMFRRAWKRDYAKFISTPSGKTAASITRVQEHTDSMYSAYNWNLLTLVASMPVLIGLMLNVIVANAIAYVCFAVVITLILRLQVGALKRTGAKLADLNTTADGNIFDSFSNFANVISFGARRKETQSFIKLNNELREANVVASSRLMTFWGSAALVMRGGLWGVILFFNLYLLKNNSITFKEFVLSVTVMIEFTNLFWRLVETFGTFTEHYSKYKTNYNFLFEGRNVVKEHFEEEVVTNSLERDFPLPDKPDFNDSIKFNNMNFAYPDRSEKVILKNLNLEIRKGEKIGVVGKSGSGKSTLVKLLLGFYEIEQGTITVDGKNVSKEELSTLNCYVPQDTTLFEQSIEYNIAYAVNSDVSFEKVESAAKRAHAHEFISSLKYGYDTLVGERGIKLSLGQRQRIALARAFLKDSQLLILDEATSSLDSKTESLVQESLEELWKNRTVIAVAHRLSTLNNVDRIIVVDDGEIVEQGTKNELLAINGIFTDLWNHQKNGMIIEDEEDEIEVDVTV